MYGETPPTVILVGPSLVEDPASLRAVAASYGERLRRTPAWLVVPVPHPLRCKPSRRAEQMRALADDAAWSGPSLRAPSPRDAMVAVLTRILGAQLPALEVGQLHPRRGAALVVSEAPCEAAAAAVAASGVGRLVVWGKPGIDACPSVPSTFEDPVALLLPPVSLRPYRA
jgi:hypothetical protein